jgi:hypothetical protein
VLKLRSAEPASSHAYSPELCAPACGSPGKDDEGRRLRRRLPYDEAPRALGSAARAAATVAGGAIHRAGAPALAAPAATLEAVATSPLDRPLPAGADVLDYFELDGRHSFARWLAPWRARIKAGELVSILVSIDSSHALAVARPGPTLPLGERQLELEL